MKIRAVIFFILSLFAVAVRAEDKAHLVVTGRVTAVSWTESNLYLRGSDGKDWRVEFTHRPKDFDRFAHGDTVVCEGDRFYLADPRSRLRNALEPRVVSHGDPLPVDEVALEDLCLPFGDKKWKDNWARRVAVEGQIIDINRRDKWVLLMIERGKAHVQCVAHLPFNKPLHEDYRIGALVRVTGNCQYSPEMDPWSHVQQGVTNYQLFAEKVSDIEVLTRAPWWTVQRLAIALTITLLALLAAVLWAMLQHHRRVKDAEVSEALNRERLRLSGDLHDNIQQLLAGATFRLDAVGNLMEEPGGLEGAKVQLAKAKQTIAHAQTGLRSVLWGLTEESEGPADLLGLFNYAASRLGHWTGRVEFRFAGDEPVSARPLAGRLLMVVQEAVGNALKHGEAGKVFVSVEFCRRGILLRVRDNGCGFDATAAVASGHYGISGMRERVREMKGHFKIESGAHGTLVTVVVPYTEAKA